MNPLSFNTTLREAREAFEKAFLQYNITKVNGNICKLSRNIGIPRGKIYGKLKQHNIEIVRK
jgi:DNA-binding NtrC family response regulator